MIETYAYARAGLLGNPSDGYFGKTISCIVRNFRARVLLYPSARLEIKPSPADTPIFQSLGELRELTRWRGYYGGVRLIQALLVRFAQYCEANGLELHDRNFTIEYETTIPQRLGLGGSSAIITATLHALMQFFAVDIPRPVQANLVLETETRELGVPAGLQDRVIQVYQGLVYMDFDRAIMESRGYGTYEELDPRLLPPLYLAYRTALSEGTEVPHSDLRHRYQSGEAAVLEAIREWAAIAAEGRTALINRDYARFARLMDQNFEVRALVCRINSGNREMVETARAAGVSCNFAGSGGAVVGCYQEEETYRRLEEAFGAMGVAIIKPLVLPASGIASPEPAAGG